MFEVTADNGGGGGACMARSIACPPSYLSPCANDIAISFVMFQAQSYQLPCNYLRTAAEPLSAVQRHRLRA